MEVYRMTLLPPKKLPMLNHLVSFMYNPEAKRRGHVLRRNRLRENQVPPSWKRQRNLERAAQIAKSMTNIELSIDQPFMDEYVAAMFLPHTDKRLFPSVDY